MYISRGRRKPPWIAIYLPPSPFLPTPLPFITCTILVEELEKPHPLYLDTKLMLILCSLFVHVHSSLFVGFLKRELLYLNAAAYFPTKSLVSEHIMDLCRNIFERGMKIKPELRRGAWLHLVGVFPPDMKRREERELYFNKLKRVYDSLRGTDVC